MKQYIVDAFTAEPFAGNPAAVCVMETWPTEAAMMQLARENNLSETAFLVREEPAAGDDAGRFRLRWFTPGCEVELCGHATLASAFTVLELLVPGAQVVRFSTMSGLLTVRREQNRFVMDFPTYPLEEIPVTDAMAAAFGARPSRAVLGLDLICVFDDEATVRGMAPNQTLLTRLPGRIQNATAPAAPDSATRPGTHCVSRSFCPKLAIAEDPVCGSAHVQIADFWCRELGVSAVDCYQGSARGGYLHGEPHGADRMFISGEAVLMAVSEIVAELS